MPRWWIGSTYGIRMLLEFEWECWNKPETSETLCRSIIGQNTPRYRILFPSVFLPETTAWDFFDEISENQEPITTPASSDIDFYFGKSSQTLGSGNRAFWRQNGQYPYWHEGLVAWICSKNTCGYAHERRHVTLSLTHAHSRSQTHKYVHI